jgi:drug/metabolite transporter (DMT)-like permease
MSEPCAAAEEERGRGILAVAACAVLWSTGGLFIKLVPWPPMAIAGMRSLIGGAVLLLYLRRPRFTWSWTQILCALCYSATMIGFVFANKLTTAANAILLQYTAPLYAAFFGALILGERTHWFDWLTIGVVVGGMGLFFMDKLSFASPAGDLIAAASGVVFALAIVLLRKQREGSPLESFVLSHFMTFLIAAPFLLLGISGAIGARAGLEPAAVLPGLGAILFLGVFQISLPSIFLSYGVRRVTALQSLLVAVLEPIFNPIWVLVFLGERPGTYALIGGAVILAAVTTRSVLSLLSDRRAAGVRPGALGGS